jgi:hypothetical protein
MLNRTKVALLVAAALSLTWLSLGVAAQPLDLKTTPPARERVAPGVPDRDLRPQRPALPDRPNFIKPLSKETRSGRAGAAGWSAPNPPVGSRMGGDHDNPGWPGVGFAIEWGRPERAN